MKGIAQFFPGPNVTELDNKTLYSDVDSTLIWHDRGQYGMASAYAILIFFVLVTVLFAVVLKVKRTFDEDEIFQYSSSRSCPSCVK